MSDRLTQGRIAPEAIRSLREKSSLPLRFGTSYNPASCYDDVRNYGLGIGDNNPLCYDQLTQI